MSDLFDRIREAALRLSPRERLLLILAGGLGLLLVLLVGVVMPVRSAIDRADQRVRNAELEIEAAVRLRREYDRLSASLGQVEQRIRGGPQGNIFTVLEELAQQSAVKVDSMEPQRGQVGERYRETKVQLVLKGVTLAQMVNYLHRIEASPQLLSVKSLRIRSRSDKPELLDVTFTVSSFEPV